MTPGDPGGSSVPEQARVCLLGGTQAELNCFAKKRDRDREVPGGILGEDR